jgi:molybdopterin-guanine dinucleotide biosynthesis protein MobB
LICALVRHFVARGEQVAAIKHTHHDVNVRRAGDTGRFLEAGAMPVILAGKSDAIVFHADSCERVTFGEPEELLVHAGGVSRILVEGFKEFGKWRRIDATRVRDVDEAIALVDRID